MQPGITNITQTHTKETES